MRLFSHACKAKEVRKFLATHKIVFEFLLQEYNKSRIDTMNGCAERRDKTCMLRQEKKRALA